MRPLQHFLKSLFIAQRFYMLLIAVVVLYIFAFFFTWLFIPAFVFSMLLVAVAIADIILLYSRKAPIDAFRKAPEKLSNGDDNPMKVAATSAYTFPVTLKLVDELPVQFQKRKFSLHSTLQPNEAFTFTYTLKPVQRGEYAFGDLQFFVKTVLGLVERRITISAQQVVPCYPSYVQMRRYQLLAATNKLSEAGVKQVRRIGHSLEFEQIKEYVNGDDYRTINWKASARRNGALMVNSYTDERSQPVYCIINCGRVMKMPFENMTLLDFAVNSSLVLSSIALVKHDKAGLVTYGDRWLHLLPAERTTMQMNNILYRLYNLKTDFLESDIEKLYYSIKTKVTQRSLLIYFTNYETFSSLKRDLPYLRMLNNNHFLLIIFFENTELKSLLTSEAGTIEEIYTKTIAEKFAYEKRLIAKELQQYGITTILTTPQELTISVINKYLEVKARQVI